METVRADTTETKRCPAAKVAKVAGLVVLGIITAAVLAIVFGLLIQWLWNELMPPIFGLPEVSYWQAVGLVVLAHILFGHHNHTHSAARKKGSRAVLGPAVARLPLKATRKRMRSSPWSGTHSGSSGRTTAGKPSPAGSTAGKRPKRTKTGTRAPEPPVPGETERQEK